MELVTSTAEETINFAKEFGSKLSPGSVVCFFGDLAAGKTTFVKGLVDGANCSSEEVCSPTFTYLNIYTGKCPIYHFDLYRLHDIDEFLSMGFDEFLHDPNGICCIEWSERIEKFLPASAFKVKLRVVEETKREIVIE